jgi:hypothetical protein
MKCKYCNKNFLTISSLNKHIKYARYCINKRENYDAIFFKCDGCDKNFTSKLSLLSHIDVCVNFMRKELEKKYNRELEIKDNIIIDLKNQLENLQNRYDSVFLVAIERPFYEETCIDTDSVDIEEYKLSSLNIGEGYNIKHREEDGYINVTNLCKAVGKKFSEWKRLEKTQAFLQALSSSMGIPADELLKYKTGSIHERATWVHPYVSINIAQWISPEFDVKVSSWVYEAMMTGKVDISNTKTFKEIQKENKTLKDKYLKRRPRVKYKDKYVIYILTTLLMQKERRYIMGKATNLTNRLSTYNKSDEHRVVYFQGCGDEKTMSLVENLVFHHLHKYREQANRERFILPENEEITLFSDTIKKSIEYCKKTNS